MARGWSGGRSALSSRQTDRKTQGRDFVQQMHARFHLRAAMDVACCNGKRCFFGGGVATATVRLAERIGEGQARETVTVGNWGRWATFGSAGTTGGRGAAGAAGPSWSLGLTGSPSPGEAVPRRASPMFLLLFLSFFDPAMMVLQQTHACRPLSVTFSLSGTRNSCVADAETGMGNRVIVCQSAPIRPLKQRCL